MGVFKIGVFGSSARQNFRINDNTAATRAAGPVMDFSSVSGLTVTGNTQPLSSGSLASTSGCSSVNDLGQRHELTHRPTGTHWNGPSAPSRGAVPHLPGTIAGCVRG